ncbi:hypothetical protein [Saccharothrix coeruleofusca]|uniref:Uncharacterized protein n=1 Tax=Saccharothrix coeruleofusca TaxID=33919 RepID=A0A918AJV0_9PSEU|nr:hypothetical protein [Saccharothrix coeruleofusca]MBP2338725.1 hypothetical protein [Saccharothrix coeruleofusca]GGP46416.1 hypothetical protein GCM10010185_17600 [Saccharothrix coeruleofusca]
MRTTASTPPLSIGRADNRGRYVSRLPVPYVTAWSAEEVDSSAVVLLPDGQGIGYRDETPLDRDERGVLLKRTPDAPNRGKPEFGVVHAARQRHAMSHLLCQVCGNPADTDEGGTLWLLQDHRADWSGWPVGMACTEPPVCEECTALAARSCPALRRGHVLLRVRSAPLVGVRGTLWGRSPLGVPRAVDTITTTFEDPLIPWVLAFYLVRQLRQATLIT